jgi:putative peptide zinc metalloprotease protein
MSGRCHRISASAHDLVGLMDGQRTVEDVWQLTERMAGDAEAHRAELIRLLGLLHSAHVLRWDAPSNIEEIFRQHQRRDERARLRRWIVPLSLRFALLDPDAVLARSVPWARRIFTPLGLGLWCAFVGAAALLALLHSSELAHDLPNRLLGHRAWLMLPIVYFVMKGVHEVAHGLAARSFGVEVHEMGVAFLVFAPLPYVDVSGVALLADKRQRIAVSLAGVAAELALSAAALCLWLALDDGLVRSTLLHVIWLGALSSVLFNANPLLRFDGYYALSDALEIPNLQQRSSQYLLSLVQRYGFGLEKVRRPVDAASERPWLVAYGLASSVYRVFLTFVIAWFVAGAFPLLGCLIAGLSIIMQLAMPIGRGLAFLLASPRLERHRARALSMTLAISAGLLLFAFVVPVPLRTQATGVVWLPEHAQVRSSVDAQVDYLLADPGSLVERGTPLFRLREPLLETEVAALEAGRRALVHRLHTEQTSDRVRARMTMEEIQALDAELSRARERRRSLIVLSPTAGRFLLSDPKDPIGRIVEQGALLGHVVPPAHTTIRVVIPESEIDLVRQRTRRVEVRLASRLADVRDARVERHFPAAGEALPSAALGPAGGGDWAVDPSDPEARRSLIPVFELDLALAEPPDRVAIGERVYARFEHGSEPIASRIGRGLSRLFLSRFGV